MNATIYIHKSNQAVWDSLEDKSAWVNKHLMSIKESTHAQIPKKDTLAQLSPKVGAFDKDNIDDDLFIQFSEMNLEPTDIYGKAWSSDREGYVKYSIVNGKVVI